MTRERTCTPTPVRDYTKFLNAVGLKARASAFRGVLLRRAGAAGDSKPRGGINASRRRCPGAIAVEATWRIVVDRPTSELLPRIQRQLPVWDFCSGGEPPRGRRGVLDHFKSG